MNGGATKTQAMASETPSDKVDRFRAQWARELPDLDTSAMTIIGRLNRYARHIAAPITETFAAFGLDRSEFDVLSTLRRSGPPYRLTPTELYPLLMLTSGGVTHLLKRLEARGFIVREASTQDGRSMAARLTTTGKAVVERAFREDMAMEAQLLACLSQKEQTQLASLLKKLLLSVEQDDRIKPPA